jgi:hypothetical protein
MERAATVLRAAAATSLGMRATPPASPTKTTSPTRTTCRSNGSMAAVGRDPGRSLSLTVGRARAQVCRSAVELAQPAAEELALDQVLSEHQGLLIRQASFVEAAQAS